MQLSFFIWCIIHICHTRNIDATSLRPWYFTPYSFDILRQKWTLCGNEYRMPEGGRYPLLWCHLSASHDPLGAHLAFGFAHPMDHRSYLQHVSAEITANSGLLSELRGRQDPAAWQVETHSSNIGKVTKLMSLTLTACINTVWEQLLLSRKQMN